MGWFKEMQVYEDNGKRKGGRGLRRPTDLILGDEYAQKDAQATPRWGAVREKSHRWLAV